MLVFLLLMELKWHYCRTHCVTAQKFLSSESRESLSCVNIGSTILNCFYFLYSVPKVGNPKVAVNQQDGTAEKIEAEGKIKSLQALTDRVRRLNR